MGDDLFTGERSSIGSMSESQLSYYGEKISPDERPPNRLTGFMSDQIVGDVDDEEAKPKKMLVGYQPNKKEEPTTKKEKSGFFAGLMKKSKTDTREKQGGALFGSARVDDTEEKLQQLFDGLLQKSDDGEFMSHKYGLTSLALFLGFQEYYELKLWEYLKCDL